MPSMICHARHRHRFLAATLSARSSTTTTGTRTFDDGDYLMGGDQGEVMGTFG